MVSLLVRSARRHLLSWALGCAGVLLSALPAPVAAAAELSTEYAAIQRAFLQEEFEAVTSLAQAFLQKPSAPAEESRVLLWLALSLHRLKQPNEALRQLDLLKVRLASGDLLWPETLYWEGEISRSALQIGRAKLSYQRLIDQHPHAAWAAQAQLGLGRIYMQQQAFDMAIPYFREIALRQSGTPMAFDALGLEGVSRLRLRQFHEAAGIFQSVLTQAKEQPVIAQAAFYLGESLLGLERYEDAIRAYQQALAEAQGSASERSGLRAQGSGPLPTAHSPEPRALEMPEWMPSARFGLGWAYYKTRRCEESLHAFEPYLALPEPHARGAEALFAQGSCFLEIGRSSDALAGFEVLLARHPGHPLALDSGLVMADIHRRHEQFDQAEALLGRLTSRHPEAEAQSRIRLSRGLLALARGDAALARDLFTAAAQSHQPDIRQSALNGLGDTEAFLGQTTEARAYYEQVIELAGQTPAAAYATYQIGRIRLQLGDFDGAAACFTQLSMQPHAAMTDDATLALAITYLNQRKEEAARTLLESLRRQRMRDPMLAGRAAYYLALLTIGKDDEAHVRRLCQDAIARAPKTEEALQARLLLVDLQARNLAPQDILALLEQLYRTPELPASHQARLAKRLGDLARNGQAYAQAIGWYEEAMRVLPSISGEIEYHVASCYEEGGDFEEAVRWYGHIEEPPWRVRGLLAAAKLLERQEQVTEAERIYRQLADERIPEAKVVQERLAVLQGESARMPGGR